ncbi:hypothetical protein SNEBB_004081 [Seison nebaliae]|nr:hypothetical protein SNEBB_004081 [Seison nebaliae]
MGEEDYESDLESEKPDVHILKEQERFLPIANIMKLMKKGIPNGGKVSKEAKELVQECASEFISFITSEAADKCAKERRKTLLATDILTSMTNLGFDRYMPILIEYLNKYRHSIQSSEVFEEMTYED